MVGAVVVDAVVVVVVVVVGRRRGRGRGLCLRARGRGRRCSGLRPVPVPAPAPGLSARGLRRAPLPLPAAAASLAFASAISLACRAASCAFSCCTSPWTDASSRWRFASCDSICAAALAELEDGLRLPLARALDAPPRACVEHLALRLHLLDQAPVESRRRVDRLEAVEDVVEVRRAEDGVDRRRVLRLVQRDQPRLGPLLGDAVAVAGPPEEHLVVGLLLLDLRELVLRAVPGLDRAVRLVVQSVAPARGSPVPRPPSASPWAGWAERRRSTRPRRARPQEQPLPQHHARKRRLLMSPISVSSPLRPPTLRAASRGLHSRS